MSEALVLLMLGFLQDTTYGLLSQWGPCSLQGIVRVQHTWGFKATIPGRNCICGNQDNREKDKISDLRN